MLAARHDDDNDDDDETSRAGLVSVALEWTICIPCKSMPPPLQKRRCPDHDIKLNQVMRLLVWSCWERGVHLRCNYF